MKRMEITGGRHGLRVKPLSTVEIRRTALWLRSTLGIGDECQPDMGRIVEFDLFRHFGLTLDLRDDREMSGDEAYALPSENTIVLSNSTYFQLLRGQRRARFTAGHEIGHIVLHSDVKLPRQGVVLPGKICESSEWQANAFSGEFLAPAYLIVSHCRSVADIATKFNVSQGCARARANRLNKEGAIAWKS